MQLASAAEESLDPIIFSWPLFTIQHTPWEILMSDATQPGWTRLRTATGRYETQFQSKMPSVRAGQYIEASDYQFLVMDEEGWLYKIPIRVADEAAEMLDQRDVNVQATAEAQLRAGLEQFRPYKNAPYEEMDKQFEVDIARARILAQSHP